MVKSNVKGKQAKNNRTPSPSPAEIQLTPCSIDIPLTSQTSQDSPPPPPSSQPNAPASGNVDIPGAPDVPDSVAVSPSLSEISFFEIPSKTQEREIACASEASTIGDQEPKNKGYDSYKTRLNSTTSTSGPVKANSTFKANPENIPGTPGYFISINSVTKEDALAAIKVAEEKSSDLHTLLMVSYTDWLRSQVDLVISRRQYSEDCEALAHKEPDVSKRLREMARYERKLNDQEDITREATRILSASSTQFTREYNQLLNTNLKLKNVVAGGTGETNL